MNNPRDEASDVLGLIAGKGAYPILLARSARREGVRRIVAIAFRGETSSRIVQVADKVHWIRLGQLGAMLDALGASGVKRAVMAGQITPTHLFRIRMDTRMLALLRRVHPRNAETIFGAVCDELKAQGIEMAPASSFMAEYMPAPGLLSARPLAPSEQHDVELGLRVAKATSGLDIGQTVVVKDGVLLAVEAFEGTDATIRRAGKLGGPGSVVVKVAKRGHDMRFDIPVIGRHTMKVLRRAHAAVLAVEAGRAILLERDVVCAEANRLGMCLVAMKAPEGEEPGHA